jgi:hypothetical protein
MRSEPVAMPRHRVADELGAARQHLTAALNHSVDGRDRRSHRHLDAAISMLYGELDDDRWTALAGSKVEHQRGDRRAARETVREIAQLVDAKLEVPADD